MADQGKINDILWHDRKRWVFFGLPFSFTRYSVSKERLFVSTGFLSVKDDEVRLYRIMDISLKRSLGQRIFGLGTVRICSADKTMKDFELKNIKNPVATKELISDLVERQRDAKRVVNRENMINYESEPDGPMGPDEIFDEDGSPFDRD